MASVTSVRCLLPSPCRVVQVEERRRKTKRESAGIGLGFRENIRDMQTDLQLPPISKRTLLIGYILSALPVLLLVFSAVLKLMKPTPVVEGFAQFGFPESLIFPLGILELACTVVYLIPRTSILGAILITGYLGGATATNVRVGEPFLGPVIAGVLAWGGLYLRDARVRALIPLQK
jgi:DoxX-like family